MQRRFADAPTAAAGFGGALVAVVELEGEEVDCCEDPTDSGLGGGEEKFGWGQEEDGQEEEALGCAGGGGGLEDGFLAGHFSFLFWRGAYCNLIVWIRME